MLRTISGGINLEVSGQGLLVNETIGSGTQGGKPGKVRRSARLTIPSSVQGTALDHASNRGDQVLVNFDKPLAGAAVRCHVVCVPCLPPTEPGMQGALAGHEEAKTHSKVGKEKPETKVARHP